MFAAQPGCLGLASGVVTRLDGMTLDAQGFAIGFWIILATKGQRGDVIGFKSHVLGAAPGTDAPGRIKDALPE